MAVVNLVKSIYTATDVTALGEIATGDTVVIPAGSTIEGVTPTGATGSGKAVFGTSPAITNATFTNYIETLYSTGNTGATETVDLANGTVQLLTLDQACTITLPAAAAGQNYTLILTGNFAPTFQAASGDTLKWAGGTAPARTASAGKYDMYCFLAIGATNVLGCDGGRNY